MKWIAFTLLLSACSLSEKKNEVPFLVAPLKDEQWATFEGRWKSPDAVIHLELSLESGSVGADAHYDLHELKEATKFASGTSSQNLYSTYIRDAGKEFGIRLHNLAEYSYSNYFRYPSNSDQGEEMFFLTRGDEELIPCDDKFQPLTDDWRSTLHKRSRPFTVEGYFTFEKDSAKFFERNAMQNWKLTELGDFFELKTKYAQLAKQKHEGIYLKGLAYSVKDRQLKDVLVIKRILDVGNDPD